MQLGFTFSQAIDIYKQTNDSDIFEDLITLQAIEEDINLSLQEKQKLVELLNSNVPKFEKRLKVMRALDKNRDFSTNIALILKERPSSVEMVKKILDVFRNHYVKNDVLKKQFGEVLTNWDTVSNMISEIDDDFWTSPFNADGSIKKILEPANGSGIFSWAVIDKYMKGLEYFITNENARYKFIVENMVYVCEIQKSKMFNWLCIIDLFDEYKVNAYCGSFLDKGFDQHFREVWGLKPGDFSLILSNPPYNSNSIDIRGSKSIYHLFIKKSVLISKMVIMITPSRWFISNDMSSFRKDMIENYGLKSISECDDNIFNDVEIKGGVSYFLIVNGYKGPVLFNKKERIFKNLISVYENDSLIHKMNKYKTLSDLFNSGGYFGIETNDKRLSEAGKYKCYASKKNGSIKYIDLDNTKENIHSYKVLVLSASGSKKNISDMGRMVLANPNELHTASFSHFIVGSKEEGINLIKYLNTKTVKYLISIKKITQRVKKDVFSLVPIVPFDREWTDEMLFEYFDLSEDEIKLILEK